jgi:hypothetical protein
MEMQPTERASQSAGRTGAIRLQIAGADLLLSGRFEQWMPVLLSTGDQGELAAVQILFDVTSNRNNGSSGKARDRSELLAFKSTSVQAVGKQAYQVKGTLRAGGVSREVEALLQNPPGHTPFFVILFRFDPIAFPALWDSLEERAAHVEAAGQEELRPRAWLKAPALAAA